VPITDETLPDDVRAADGGEILAALRSLLPDLKDRYGVVRLELFGSWVRGEQRPDSDVDLLVEFREPPGLLGFLALEREISYALGRPVDLVSARAPRRRIGRAIRSQAVPV
jgi:predicted nucleotidyltransferase